jgi:NAD(P)H-dependent flavin oxidoreductase YrpB (nitropropane dioxygenase family)
MITTALTQMFGLEHPIVLAAALMLGAHGALIGTRFYASAEVPGHDGARLAHAGESAAGMQR